MWENDPGEEEKMESMPVYWKTRPEDVEETCALVKRGRVTMPTRSAGGRPIYMIEYGKSNLKRGKATLSSALGGFDIRAYADKTGDDYIPTVFLVGAVHGGEFEGTSAILNLIKLLETGTDYAGEPREEMVKACEGLHLILIPLINPDGRSRVPFDSFVGKTFHDLRYYCQGAWKDGTLCGYPGCKMMHPIKDYVSYLGSYFNDDGFNMMHEDFMGGNVSRETRLLLDVCRQEAPDFSILLHGGDNCPNHMIPPAYAFGRAMEEALSLSHRVEARHEEVGLPFAHQPNPHLNEANAPLAFNLVSAMHHSCGEPAVTFESNQGLVKEESRAFTYEEIYLAHRILFTEVCCQVREKFAK